MEAIYDLGDLLMDTSLPLPDWVMWIAQDESGAWWGYSVEPLRNDSGWYENEVGKYIRLGISEPLRWANSLRAVKDGKSG